MSQLSFTLECPHSAGRVGPRYSGWGERKRGEGKVLGLKLPAVRLCLTEVNLKCKESLANRSEISFSMSLCSLYESGLDLK